MTSGIVFPAAAASWSRLGLSDARRSIVLMGASVRSVARRCRPSFGTTAEGLALATDRIIDDVVIFAMARRLFFI
jgi:hypothetical protein